MQPSHAQRMQNAKNRRVARPAVGGPSQRRPANQLRVGGPQRRPVGSGQRRPVGAQQRRPVAPGQRPQRPPQPRPGQPQQRPPQQQRPQQKAFNPFSLLQGPLANYKFGKVRKVVSGDTLIVETIHESQPTDPRLREPLQIQLDGVSCPHVTRSKNDKKSEECFGWEAREFLRKTLIGAFIIYESKDLNANKADPAKDSKMKFDRRRRRERGKVRYNLKDAYKPPGHDPAWKDIADLMVENGYATVKSYAFGQEDEPQKRLAILEALETQAREGKRGQHQERPADEKERIAFFRKNTRIVDWTPNTQNLCNKYKGKQLKAVVDDVRDGSTIKCEIMLNDEADLDRRSTMVFIHLSGAQCQSMPKPVSVQKREAENRGNSNPTIQKAGPLAVKAMQYTKSRLLGQQVTVTIDTMDQSRASNLFGTVNFVKGDIAALLIRQGLAEVTNWTAVIVGKEEKYVKMQERAQAEKQGIWKEKEIKLQKKESRVFVAEVHSGDAVWCCTEEITQKPDGSTVKKLGDKQKVFLGSIQCPSLGNRKMKKPMHPYAWEAKEFVRGQLIGQYVTLKQEYSREMNLTRNGKSRKEKANHVTITYVDASGKVKNISEQLVAKGYARLIPHGKNDQRVSNYYLLSELRDKARNEKIGIHTEDVEKKYKEPKFNDMYSNDGTREQRFSRAKEYAETRLGLNIETAEERRGKRLLGTGQKMEDKKKVVKTKKLKAVVDYVASGNRLKVRLPEHKTIFALHLTGVRCPRINNDLETVKKVEIAKKAQEIVKQHTLQREVWVVIESCDSYGNFIGHCLTAKGVNIGVELLRGGYGEVGNRMSVEKSAYKKELEEAETEAKEKRNGVFENWTPEQDAPKEDERKPREPRKRREDRSRKREEPEVPRINPLTGKTITATVTHLESGTTFYAVQESETKKKIDAYMATVNPTSEDNKFQDGWEAETGEIVACLFEDGQYYRARVGSMKNKGTAECQYKVIYIDFGNGTFVPDHYCLQIRTESIKQMDPLAMKCELAGLIPPPTAMERYWSQAGQVVSNFAQPGNGVSVQLEVVKVVQQGRGRGRRRETLAVNMIAGKVNVNEKLLKMGLARVDERNQVFKENAKLKKDLQAMRKAALDAHKGMYLYGDLDSDDEDEQKGKGKRGKRGR